MLDCVDQLSTPAAAAAAAAMCSGLDVTDTTHERSGSTTENGAHKNVPVRIQYTAIVTLELLCYVALFSVKLHC